MDKTEESIARVVQPFGQVPAALIMDIELTPGARLLCAYLWTYANPQTDGFVWPSQERMKKHLGVSRRSILRWIEELHDRGWLVKAKRSDLDPDWKGHPAACIYQLMQSCHGDTRVTQDRDTRVTLTVTPESQEQTREQTNRTDKVVVDNSKELDSLKLYASKNPRIKNPTGWAMAMHKRGITLEQVLNDKSNGRSKKAAKDSDSEDARQRYVTGKYQGFWGDPEPEGV